MAMAGAGIASAVTVEDAITAAVALLRIADTVAVRQCTAVAELE
jgi:hypothetical protein